ncbi:MULTISPECIES: SGNH/GDSL hydrolase family protein [Olivibacter]|uniref:SGNH hydrolase-type esterase domain-containing protein n=3 Tax=Sphingobacteriaceae TaxID=84566 RepID=F4CEW5_SPHS2|nr:SGNH/GDSL hydrolase family protein [Olivibacter sp. 47]MCL4642140.1 SGNH/GDSL hydrolase family protein [Olivibacter sp. UJ_SKK_5.1]MDM8176295.1 SGNH/GDSL hydrolase family protein [Olivibacter sp. 47]MDX3915737.1 SGNH/GDSL hydrolase family protein [Pseudosphingobacterium sp.]
MQKSGCILSTLFVTIYVWMAGMGVIRAQDAPYPLEHAKRILFLGNSITYGGDYVSIFETSLSVSYPANNPEVINLALPSETVSGLSEPDHADGKFPRPCLFSRVTSVLQKSKPIDIAFACYGMNDGIYLPFDMNRFEAYKRGMIRLRDSLEAAGVKRIIFMTPPIHDDKDKGLGGYNLVLDKYAEWLLAQRKARGWEVIDVHFPMRAYLEKKRQKDADFKLAEDGVHPGKEGHWLIAKALLQYFHLQGGLVKTLNDFLESQPYIVNLYTLIGKRQSFMKDAWLTYTGHERPGMPIGLPMEEAAIQYEQLEREIFQLKRN